MQKPLSPRPQIGRPARVGIVAEQNGAQRAPAKVVDFSANQRSVLDRQFQFIAEGLSRIDDLEKTLGEVRALVLQLADGLHVSRGHWRESVDVLSRTVEASASMVEDLAKESAEMRGELDIMRGEIDCMGRAENPARLLEMGDDD
jgi:hypothetical protein